MSRSTRRRRVIFDSLQYRVLGESLFHYTIVVFVFAVVLFGPLIMDLTGPTGGEAREASSAHFLFLHARMWLAALVALILVITRSLFASRRLVGPLCRLRQGLRAMRDGNLTLRVQVRRRDYAHEETIALNETIDALCTKVQDVDLKADEIQATIEEVRKAAAADSRDTVIQRVAELEDRSAELRAQLRRFRLWAGGKEGRTPGVNPDGKGSAVVQPVPMGTLTDGAAFAQDAAARRGQRGFSVIEMLLAFAILITLSGIAIPLYSGALEAARITRAIGDVRAISRELVSYQLLNGALPGTLAELGKGNHADPWGNLYAYLNFDGVNGQGAKRKDQFMVPLNSTYDLYSVGKDGTSVPPLQAAPSRDDIVMANDGAFIGLAKDY